MAVAPGQLAIETYEARFAPERVRALRSHARFNEALRHSLVRPLELHAADPRMWALLKDSGKLFSGLLCVYLHSTGGLTMARVRQHCADSGIISPGAAESLLAHMRDMGFVEAAPEQPSRREVRMVAAPRLLATFLERTRLEIEAASLLQAGMTPLLNAWDRPGVFEAFMAVQIRDVLSVTPFTTGGDPGLSALFSYNSGALMLMRLMVGGPFRGPYQPDRPSPLSMIALATEFDVSRAHVQRFIQAAEGFGFLERSEDGRAVRLLPSLVEAQSELYAFIYAQTLDCAAEVMPGLGLV